MNSERLESCEASGTEAPHDSMSRRRADHPFDGARRAGTPDCVVQKPGYDCRGLVLVLVVPWSRLG